LNKDKEVRKERKTNEEMNERKIKGKERKVNGSR
jgi:hypothetical protein